MTRKKNYTDSVAVFIPSQASVLLGCELEKGKPLTEQEVIAIREQCRTVVISKSEALRLAERRGYKDIDPMRSWETWQKLRKKMKPRPNG